MLWTLLILCYDLLNEPAYFFFKFSAFSFSIFAEWACYSGIYTPASRNYGSPFWQCGKLLIKEKTQETNCVITSELFFFPVWIGYHVSFGESALHAGGNGDEWLYCRNEQGQHPLSNTANGQSIMRCSTWKVVDIYISVALCIMCHCKFLLMQNK